MIKKITIFTVLVILFAFRISFADTREVILKDGQSFGDIFFKKEYPGKLYFKDKLLFEGGEGYDENSPKAQIEKVSIINLKTKYNIYACANFYCAGYLVDKKSGELKESFGQKYSYPKFFTESKDGKYFILYYYYEDQEISDNSVSLVLIDIENPENDYYKYIESDLPKNFNIDDKYQFSFEDKTGIVKGDLLEFFKKEDSNLNNNPSNDENKQETRTNYSNNSKLEVIIFVVLWVALIVFLVKSKKSFKK